MTLTDLQALASTDEGRERIRVMVAEANGWTYQLEPSNEEMEDARLGRGAYTGVPGYPIGGGPLGGLQCRVWRSRNGNIASLPSLSLDACAEFEAGLTDEERVKYYHVLERVCVSPNDRSDSLYFVATETVSAPAAHRCIAYILTKQSTKGAE